MPTEAELLEACAASGQMDSRQVAAHVEAGEMELAPPIGMRIESWACYGLGVVPLTPEQRSEIINYALVFDECQDSRETLESLSDQSLVNAAYWAMAEYAQGQM